MSKTKSGPRQKSKSKSKELLTAKEIKDMIYEAIQKKQKAVDPDKFKMRIVEDNLAEVEAMQQIHAMILDEENRRKRYTNSGQTTLKPSTDKRLK
ncbi:MAG TPA: hypothetical protein VH500_23140 [Nitrososphaeraceae archaeon]